MDATSSVEDYTGHERDAETGLHYAGARYYMSALGRWTSGEPLLNGDPRPLLNDQRQVLLAVSPYNYSLNNPANLRDPDGRCPVCFVAVWAAVEVGLAAYDAYDVYNTFSDPNSTTTERAISAGGALLGALAPGGGYSAADDLAKLTARFAGSFDALQTSGRIAGKVSGADQGLKAVEGILKPGGELLGDAGSEGVRELSGASIKEAKALAGKIAGTVGGKVHKTLDRGGVVIKLDNDLGFITYRTFSTKSGDATKATVDINIQGFDEVDEIKFNK